MRAPLTSTQKQVFDFVCEYRASRGVSPTLQEIGDHLKVHRVTVHAHVKALLEKKYLVRFSKRASRSLIPYEEAHAGAGSSSLTSSKTTSEQSTSGKGGAIRPAAWPVPKFQASRSRGLREAESAAGTGASISSDAAPTSDEVNSGTSARQTPASGPGQNGQVEPEFASQGESEPGLTPVTQGSLLFPLAGRIAAGRPIESVYDNEVLDVTALFPHERDLYVLEVNGDSMIEEQIKGGDYVVCERRSTARNGEIVVAVLPNEFGGGGEATLKRFFREGNRVRLQPANREMSPIFIEAPRKVEIRGVVVGVIRRY